MAQLSGYWNKVLASRLSRRRALRAGAAFGAGAAALSFIGCGGNDDGGTTDASSQLYKPVDTTAKAVKGGVYTIATNDDVGSFDSITGVAQDVIHANRAYSRLVRYQTFKYPEPVQAVAAPDAATSWETSPDGLQITYKIRPNFKFDPRPPTSGRAMTAQDVKFSIDRFLRASPNRASLANAVDPAAPIVSTEAPDDRTVTIKMAFPYALMNLFMGYYRFVTILPVEADGKFDVRETMRGTGAWRLQEDTRSVRVTFNKNPDWYEADKVNLEGINSIVIKDTSAGTAQFRAGNLWTYAIPQEEVLPTKQQLPELLMRPQEEFSGTAQYIRFGYQPGSPFLDDRVRKALSLLIDRDLEIQTFGNVDAFKKAGLAVPERWNTHVSCGYDGLWMDPKDTKTFGEHAKWFTHDPAEAKKLMRAAGHTSALEAKWSYSTGLYQPIEDRRNEVLHSMWQEGGDFKLSVQTMDYRNQLQPNYVNNFDKHDGIFTALVVALPEVDNFFNLYVKSGTPRSGHLASDGKPDSVLDDMVARQRVEADPKKRQSIVQEMQRHMASKMYFVLGAGQSLGFNLAWPWLSNWGVYRSIAGGSADQEGNIYHWYDASKKKKA